MILCIGIITYAGLTIYKNSQEQLAIEEMSDASWVDDDFYSKEIQPIFDAKCIACHSCYNAPCQLNLINYEGVMRGANQTDLYKFPLVSARHPTRLGQDARMLDEWRELEFYDITGDSADSLLLTLLDMERGSDYQENHFVAESSRTCPKPGIIPEDITLIGSDHLSMPFGLPELTDYEKDALRHWVSLGTPGPATKIHDDYAEILLPRIKEEITQWEHMLNEHRPQNILSARYMYEHLFIAHITFFDDSKVFFRLVRASNPKGEPEELNTARPIDPTGQKFYYRFKIIDQSLVSKTHTVFLLGEREKSRFKEEFLSPKWSVTKEELPGYDQNSANPFTTFKSIPRKIRYKFFLDNSRYFVTTFMKGPVCRGQTALNVINDHFWVFFLDPEFDISANLDTEFNRFSHLLSPPATKKEITEIFNELRQKRWQAHINKTSLYEKLQKKFSLQAIWNGDGNNPNASLTIYRHFDSADVLFGARGEVPKTVWLMDYQIFEDIYYNLVAGYNLFGPMNHQLNTRLYMELSRITSEDMFINLLPQQQREALRLAWSQESPETRKTVVAEIIKLAESGATDMIESTFDFQGRKLETLVVYNSNQNVHGLKEELLRQIREVRLPSTSKLKYEWDQHYFMQEQLHETWIKKHFGPILKLKGPFPERLPDAILVRINGVKNANAPKVMTIAYNKAHYNVNMLFMEDMRRWPPQDTLSFLNGIATNYPNFYLEVNADQLFSFVQEFKKVLLNPAQDDLIDKFFNRYGISRFSTDFWQKHQWFNDTFRKERPIEYGVLDLNRYAPH